MERVKLIACVFFISMAAFIVTGCQQDDDGYESIAKDKAAKRRIWRMFRSSLPTMRLQKASQNQYHLTMQDRSPCQAAPPFISG